MNDGVLRCNHGHPLTLVPIEDEEGWVQPTNTDCSLCPEKALIKFKPHPNPEEKK